MLDKLALTNEETGALGDNAWGPVLTESGTRFRLWAPSQNAVKLRLSGDHAMTRSGDGWFDIEIDHQPFGVAYGFVLDDGQVVPDPASHAQQTDVSGLSILTDPKAYDWQHSDWRGRPWHETIVYELHVGAFTPEGTFQAATAKLAQLAELGVTAVELLPLAQFPGSRGWGYDGVMHYAPHNAYGSPDDLKAFIDTAHGLDLMVFLDVVYNHFGPEGNFLSQYAPAFFREGKQNDWGDQIAFECPAVRRYFIDNAIYWLDEFRLDGLRFDAVNEIKDDDSEIHILEEISTSVRTSITDRHVHLMIENPPNGTDLLAQELFLADWNDGFHHVIHRIVTGETSGIFEKFAPEPFEKLRKIMAEGYLNRGEPIVSDALPPSRCLPPMAFIHFLQNHDQVGNRALGDRLHTIIDEQTYKTLMTVLMLSPQIPLIFMGDHYKDDTPFHFFADYAGELADAMRENRAPEAENFGGYPEGKSAEDIPDPNDETTFTGSKIDWAQAETAEGKAWSSWLRRLIEIRREYIVPQLSDVKDSSGTVLPAPEQCVFVDWTIGSIVLQLRLNLSDETIRLEPDLSTCLWPADAQGSTSELPPVSVAFFLRER